MNNAQKSKYLQSLVDWETAIKMYEDGESITSVARHFNVTYDFMRVQLKNRGVVIRQGSKAHVKDRKYNHQNIFEPLTNEGAYLLGWLLADGNLSTDGQVRMFVGEEDKEHLEYLARLFTDAPIRKEHRKKYDSYYYGFNIKNAEIYKSLEKLGLKTRKSYRVTDLSWELIKDDQIPYLLLGMMEGDGHVAKDSNIVRLIMYQPTLENIQKRFLDKLGIVPTSILHDDRWNMKELCDVKFSGKEYFNLMVSLYIYTPDVKPLPRKKERFIQNCERVASSKSTHRKLAENCLRAVKG